MQQNLRKWGGCLAVVLAAVLVWQGCQTVPVTGRRQFNIVGAAEELQLGISSFEQLKKDTPVNRDPAINALVQRVGQRVAAVAELPGAQWEFVVFETKEPNAFCLPGGKVGVNTGILPITQDEAGLATVIGHEVAHAAAHHGGERMSESLALQTGGQLLGSGLATTDPRWQAAATTAYGLATQVGLQLPHSRSQESEADRIGLIYMARAGYQPEASVAFWQRFSAYNKQAGGNTTPAFLRTHPLDDKRIQDLQLWMPEAKQNYRPAK
jgi:metalloendopeptidase OMA1, mitochondrial